MSKFKTTIEIDGEQVIECSYDENSPEGIKRLYHSLPVSSKKKYVQAVSEIQRLCIEIMHQNIKTMEKKADNGEIPLVLF